MASDRDLEYYEAYYDDDDDDSEQVKTQYDNAGENDNQNNGIMIMDGDGNYYFTTSDKLVKVEKVENVDATVVAPTVKRKVTALRTACTISSKKIKLEIGSEQKQNLNATTTSIPAENQVEVYEFNEIEQDADDPQVGVVADYETKGVVVKNIKKSNADEPFNCVLCPFKTHKKFLLSNHMKTHSDERPYKCSVCERGFKTSSSLKNHKNTHLGHKPYACKDCDKAFTTSGELVRHVRYRHTHIKPHKCTECEYSSVELSKVRRHMRCHTGERPYQCPHCTYASPDTFKLKRHLRIHTGEKPYECDICHARFTQLNSLKHHRLIHSVSEKPVFQCHLCPTTCGRKTDLRLHIKTLHNSDHPIPCKRCGKELPDRYSYKMHVKTHQGEKCYRCEFCPYAAVSQRHIESHVLIHLDKKPFECELCQSSFRQKQLWSRHMKIYHSDNYEPPQRRNKDHKCPHCNKKFAFNGFLIRHMEVHDPTSRINEVKQTLKLGRMRRVKQDGTIITVPDYKPINKELQVKCEEGINQEEDYAETYNAEDNNIHYEYEEFVTEDYNEETQEHVVEEEQDVNGRKMAVEVKMNKNDGIGNNNVEAQQKHFSKFNTLSNEVDESLSLEANDDQGFMVIEVLPDDDDDNAVENEAQTAQENSQRIVYLNDKTTTNKEPVTSDYFGFEVDEEEEDKEAKGAIELLEMIEQEKI